MSDETTETETEKTDTSAPASANATGDDDDTDIVFDTLWDRVLAAWDEDKTHSALIEHAVRSQQLPALAGRYKKMVGDPDKGERAKKKLDGVVLAATQMLLATKTPDLPERPKWLTVLVGIACVVLVLWVAYRVVMSRPT